MANEDSATVQSDMNTLADGCLGGSEIGGGTLAPAQEGPSKALAGVDSEVESDSDSEACDGLEASSFGGRRLPEGAEGSRAEDEEEKEGAWTGKVHGAREEEFEDTWC